MNLKEARKKGELEAFIKEREKEGDKEAFEELVSSMVGASQRIELLPEEGEE